MDSFKSPVSRLARLFKRSRDAWKAKALEKQQRLRAAQVRIRDLEKSRAYWKERALAGERKEDAAPSEVASDEEAPPEEPAQRLALSTPARHGYALMVIQLTLQLYLHTGIGLRGVGRVLQWFAPWWGLSAGPAPNSVRNWLYRCGLALLQRPPARRAD